MMKQLIISLSVLLTFTLSFYTEQSRSDETETPVVWGVPASPAVVNPPIRSQFHRFQTLSGEWKFKTDDYRTRLRVGYAFKTSWDNTALSIKIPGCWESQGIGTPGDSIPWDPAWDRSSIPLRHVFMGMGTYKKTFKIPSDWKGQQIWLKVGGVRSEAYIWINQNQVAYINSYCGTYKYNITQFVKQGEENTIIAAVRNDVPSRKGNQASKHKYGGFYRDIELEATPDTWIDDVWVRGNFAKRSAQVHLSLASVNKSAYSQNGVACRMRILDSGKKEIAVKTVQIPIGTETQPQETVVEIPVPNARLWSPESPYLYSVDVSLLNNEGKEIHGWVERFGIRKLEVVGRKFFLNEKPYFLRGGGDHMKSPFHIILMPNRKEIIEHQKTYKAAGFNYTRHHTQCPIPEYFEAADETGLLIQPELPYYSDFQTDGGPFDPMTDMKELYRHFRRYVSFATYCTGNEGWLGSPADQQLYSWAKKHDPDRLFIHQDGGVNPKDFSDFDTGPINQWIPGQYNHFTRPFIAHEYLNLAIKIDPRLADRFTGAMIPPEVMTNYSKHLLSWGLTPKWGDLCILSAHHLQGIWLKHGFEAARLDPECDGYSYWAIIDGCTIQAGTFISQGYLNPFWEPKPGSIAPNELYHSNGPSVFLLKNPLQNSIFTSGDSAEFEFHFSHFGYNDLPAGAFQWKISIEQKIVAEGKLNHHGWETGKVGSIGKATLSIPNVTVPSPARLSIEIPGTNISNSWNLWLFPRRETMSVPNLVVSPSLWNVMKKRYHNIRPWSNSLKKEDILLVSSEEKELIKKGIEQRGRIIILAPASTKANIHLGWWTLSQQLGMAIPNHPIFGDFPKSEILNELWFRLVRQNAPDLKKDLGFGKFEPLAIGEGINDYKLYMGLAQKDEAVIIALFAIDLLQETPEAINLLDNIVRYLSKKQ